MPIVVGEYGSPAAAARLSACSSPRSDEGATKTKPAEEQHMGC